MSGETEQQPSGWTIDSLKAYFEQRLNDRDDFLNRLAAERDKQVSLAFSAAAEAVRKAETAAEKRFDAVNEFRGQLADQARDFMPRNEAELLVKALAEKIDALIGTRSQGVNVMIGYILAAVAVLGLIVTILATR